MACPGDSLSLPALLPRGLLLPGGHAATRHEMRERCGTAPPRRQGCAERLEALRRAARATGKLQRVLRWGSRISDALFPSDGAVGLLMPAGLDREWADLPSPQREVWAHASAR